MAESRQQPSWLSRILPLLHYLAPDKLTFALSNILDLWDLLVQARDRIGYHGVYEILEYDSTLEILDPRGKEAQITRHQVIRFLQDNVVAIHDHAWGDGELFAEYHCQPGVPVDFYEDGSRQNVLISLRETKNRGDTVDLWIHRVIKGGFRDPHGWLETEIDHRTTKLKLSVVFPRERPCRRATLSRRSTSKVAVLGKQHFAYTSDGRQKLAWEASHPKLHDRYTIKWRW